MSEDAPTVFVVEDDEAVLKAVTRLLQSSGYRVRAFRSSETFLAAHDPAAPGCLLLDIALPGLDGLQLQQTLCSSGRDRVIVFITGRGDIAMSVRAMKAGAVDFLTKPFDRTQLIAAIGVAVERDLLVQRRRAEVESIEQRMASLTWRERQV